MDDNLYGVAYDGGDDCDYQNCTTKKELIARKVRMLAEKPTAILLDAVLGALFRDQEGYYDLETSKLAADAFLHALRSDNRMLQVIAEKWRDRWLDRLFQAPVNDK